MGLHASGEGLNALNDEQVDDLAGGYIHYAGGRFGGYSTYEVIDDKSGKVLATFEGQTYDAMAKAKEKAAELGMSTDSLTDNQLGAIREWYKKGK